MLSRVMILSLFAGLCALSECRGDVDGIILPRHRVQLSLPLEARVREVPVQEGQMVKKGDVLAVLYTEVEEAERDLAEAQLKKAEYTYQAKLRLNERNAIASQEMVYSEMDLQFGKISLERAKAVLRGKMIVAPWDGQVLRIYKTTGETVNSAEKLIELIDYAVIYVDVYLEAGQLGNVKPGQLASISGAALGDAPRTATVKMVDPVVEPGSGLFRVRLSLENPGFQISTGLPVKVHFQ